jgi:hypothetical protein
MISAMSLWTATAGLIRPLPELETPILLLLLFNGFLLLVLSALLGYRKPLMMLGAFLLGLLVQEQVIRMLRYALQAPETLTQAISLWKEIALLGMLAGLVLRRLLKVRYQLQFGRADLLLLAIALVALLHTAFSPNRLAAMAALRNYFEPLLLFYLARSIPYAERGLRQTMWVILGMGLVTSLLGTWQALAWDALDFQRWGYVHPDRWIPTVMVGEEMRFRPSSLVAGPNVLGAFQVLFLAIAAGLAATARTRWRWVAAGGIPILFIGLMYSYSRSALVTLALSAVVLLAASMTQRSFRSRVLGWLRKPVTLGLIALLVLGFIAVFALSGMVDRVLDSLASLSSQFHFVDKVTAIEELIRHPAGIGMGLVGPRDGRFFPEVEPFKVESSLLQIAFDMGIYGLALWLAFWTWLLAWLKQGWAEGLGPTQSLLALISFCLWPGYLAAFLFLPLMQSLALMSWLWSLSGLAMAESKEVTANG